MYLILFGRENVYCYWGRHGIRKTLALAFLETGADVAVCELVVDGWLLEGVAKEIKRTSWHSQAFQADITSKSDVDNAVQQVIDQVGVILTQRVASFSFRR